MNASANAASVPASQTCDAPVTLSWPRHATSAASAPPAASASTHGDAHQPGRAPRARGGAASGSARATSSSLGHVGPSSAISDTYRSSSACGPWPRAARGARRRAGRRRACPCSMTRTRSHSRSATPSRWVDIRIAAPASAVARQRRARGPRRVRVEPVERLVEQHELDRADERRGEPDPLAHAERQLAARPLRDAASPRPFEHRRARRGIAAPRASATNPTCSSTVKNS